MRSKEYRVKVAPIAWQRVVRKADRSYDSQAKDKVCFGLYTSQQHTDLGLHKLGGTVGSSLHGFFGDHSVHWQFR